MVQYARTHQTVMVATGEQDFVTDGKNFWVLSNGHPLLARVTGSGCMLTGVIGAFLVVAHKETALGHSRKPVRRPLPALMLLRKKRQREPMAPEPLPSVSSMN